MKLSDGSRGAITLGTNLETDSPFTIPVGGAATKTLGIFGKKGSGKTWTAAVWVEQLLAHKIPVVILDPVGRWWDLGLAADGQSPGLPIAVLGGQHGQVELTPNMGRAIARYVAEKHVPTVVDLSYESKATWRRVVGDFCEELFRVNQLPVHVVLEEAPEFIPQRLFGDNAAVFGAVDKLVRLGRNRGIGITVIGQRLQTTNKDTVSQVDALIVLRLVDPQGKKAAREWVLAKGEEERADDFVDALASLKTGSGYIWSPEWLEEFVPVGFAPRQTFHYDAERAATALRPTGEIARAVDTEELTHTFARFMVPLADQSKPIPRSESAGVRRIAELEHQIESLSAALEAAQAQVVTEAEIEHRVEVAVQNATAEMRSRLAQFEGYVASVVKQGQALVSGETIAAPSVLARGVAAPQHVAEYVAKQSTYYSSRTVTKVLRTLADNYSRFLNGMTAEEIATEAGYDPYGGRFQGTLRKLVKRRVLVKEGERFLLNPAHLK
jgi:Helicase HerA, central domain